MCTTTEAAFPKANLESLAPLPSSSSGVWSFEGERLRNFCVKICKHWQQFFDGKFATQHAKNRLKFLFFWIVWRVWILRNTWRFKWNTLIIVLSVLKLNRLLSISLSEFDLKKELEKWELKVKVWFHLRQK